MKPCLGAQGKGAQAQDDLQAVEMLHSNPEGYTHTPTSLGNLSHETQGRILDFLHHLLHHLFLLVPFMRSSLLSARDKATHASQSSGHPSTTHDDMIRLRCNFTPTAGICDFAFPYPASFTIRTRLDRFLTCVILLFTPIPIFLFLDETLVIRSGLGGFYHPKIMMQSPRHGRHENTCSRDTGTPSLASAGLVHVAIQLMEVDNERKKKKNMGGREKSAFGQKAQRFCNAIHRGG